MGMIISNGLCFWCLVFHFGEAFCELGQEKCNIVKCLNCQYYLARKK